MHGSGILSVVCSSRCSNDGGIIIIIVITITIITISVRYLVLSHRQYGPWGTPENPKRVPSTNGQRQVGVVDPDDDTLIHWHLLDEGDPPVQIIPGGEFYVLQPVEAPYW